LSHSKFFLDLDVRIKFTRPTLIYNRMETMSSIKEPLTISEVSPRAGKKEWIGLGVIALPCALYSMDLTVLNLAVPHLTVDLKPSSSELLWIVDIYGFLVAGLLITMGTLGDRIGRRRLLMIGAAAFGLASVLAAYSTTAEMLIAARAILGIAGATLAPSTLSLIRNMFLDPKQRTIAIGVWVASYSAGGAVGPVIGGLMLEYYWWGSVFLIAVPVMILLLTLGPVLLPEFKDPNAGKLDFISAFLSLSSVLSIIFGLKKMAENGFDWLPVFSVIIGILIGILFLRRQRRLKDPMIDLNLFAAPAFSAALTIYTLITFIAFGGFIFIFQYLQLVQKFSPMEAGLLALPSFGGFIIGSVFAPMLAHRIRPVNVITAGLVMAAIGFGLITQVDVETGLGFLVTGMLVYSLGLAPVITLATDLIVGAAPPERAGVASAISETSSEFGGALGIAILGSIGTAIYRMRMKEGIPSEVSNALADEATETLGAAVTVASKISDDASAQMLATANDAFVTGMQVNSLIGAIIAIGLAFLAAFFLKNVKGGGH
jgi:MFS transporter, DHA2 family, multidrug resistance protein